MPIFTPPIRSYNPTVNADTPEWQMKPAIFFSPSVGKGVNVWLDTANAISETQPARASQVKKVWLGGHIHTITEDEAVMLRSAGYTANIV